MRTRGLCFHDVLGPLFPKRERHNRRGEGRRSTVQRRKLPAGRKSWQLKHTRADVSTMENEEAAKAQAGYLGYPLCRRQGVSCMTNDAFLMVRLFVPRSGWPSELHSCPPQNLRRSRAANWWNRLQSIAAWAKIMKKDKYTCNGCFLYQRKGTIQLPTKASDLYPMPLSALASSHSLFMKEKNSRTICEHSLVFSSASSMVGPGGACDVRGRRTSSTTDSSVRSASESCVS